jgi:hypothetical protein
MAKTARKTRATSKSAGRSRAAATKRKKKPAASDEQAQMEAWQRTMTPGPGHARFEPMVGTWTAKTTMTMGPGAPKMVSEGVSDHRLILGGRYLEQHYRGTAMGMPFEGRGYTAYDNARGRYVGTWMDTFGTGMMHSVGSGKPSAKRMDFEAESHDPSGKRMKFDCALKVRDKDHHTYEMWTKAPGGKRYRCMLIEYTRT